MMEVYMSMNKGLIEFSILKILAQKGPIFRIDYKVHTLKDINEIYAEFQQVMMQALNSYVSYEDNQSDHKYLVLIPVPSDDCTAETIAAS